MNVLIACEESQVVCKAFRERGHRAFSCDLQECSGGHPEWHIRGDATALINGNCTFKTADTHTHRPASGIYSLHIHHAHICQMLVLAGYIRKRGISMRTGSGRESWQKTSSWSFGMRDAKGYALRIQCHHPCSVCRNLHRSFSLGSSENHGPRKPIYGSRDCLR